MPVRRMAVIDGDTLGELTAWQLPSMDSPASVAAVAATLEESVPAATASHELSADPGTPSAEELEAIREAARSEGLQLGYQEGLQRADQEIGERILHLDALLNALSGHLDRLDEEVENELVGLAIDIARQLVRRELRTQRRQIVAIVRDALALLPVNQRLVRIHLHPDDIELVRALLEADQRPWQIENDPLISRGGCRVTSETSQIDATVEYRIGEVIARVLGDDRRIED